jgi:hypothetical protein
VDDTEIFIYSFEKINSTKDHIIPIDINISPSGIRNQENNIKTEIPKIFNNIPKAMILGPL